MPAKPTTSQSLEPEGKAPASKPESQGKKTLKQIIPAPAPSSNHKQEIAKKSHISWMTYPDHMKLADATPLYPTTSVKLCWTRVMPEMFTTDYLKEGSARVSVYSCLLNVPGLASWKYNYTTSNSGQIGTHICRCHLGICIQCKKCSFRTCDMKKHLKLVHANDAHLFYDDMPDLSGMQATSNMSLLNE